MRRDGFTNTIVGVSDASGLVEFRAVNVDLELEKPVKPEWIEKLMLYFHERGTASPVISRNVQLAIDGDVLRSIPMRNVSEAK